MLKIMRLFMKNMCAKIVLLGLVVSGDSLANGVQDLTTAPKSENQSFYSIIEKSSSTGGDIDTEVFRQTSESITNKKAHGNPNITPQNVSPLAPKQNQWLNNKPHGEYFDDTSGKRELRKPLTDYKPISLQTDREMLSIQNEVLKSAIDINSTPYYKKAYRTEETGLKNQLSSMSKTIKEEEKKITRELDSLSKELAMTSKKMPNNGIGSDPSITNQLAVSSRLAGNRYETPDDYIMKQLTVSSKAMQRNNTFYPDTMGANDMKKLIRSSDSIDNGKRKKFGEVLDELFSRKPKSVVTPAKPGALSIKGAAILNLQSYGISTKIA